MKRRDEPDYCSPQKKQKKRIEELGLTLSSTSDDETQLSNHTAQESSTTSSSESDSESNEKRPGFGTFGNTFGGDSLVEGTSSRYSMYNSVSQKLMVQTGFGRTGSHFWGFEGHGVVPDIVTLAKGMGNGFPMAAVVAKAEIVGCLAQGLPFNTFGGNPVACVVGSAVLDAIEEDGLQENCEAVGTYLLREFARLREEFEIVGDVRGKGLMIGIQMVKDKESRRPLPAEEISEIFEDCKDMGVLFGKGGIHVQTFRIKPPMCITKGDADFAVDVFHTALTRHKERMVAAK